MISDCLPLVCTGLADSAGNVTVSHPVTSVNGMTGAVTLTNQMGMVVMGNANASLKLPSGGTWKCVNIISYDDNSSASYDSIIGVSNNNSTSYSATIASTASYGGNTTVYPKYKYGFETNGAQLIKGTVLAVRTN